jgi:hypothetical protein
MSDDVSIDLNDVANTASQLEQRGAEVRGHHQTLVSNTRRPLGTGAIGTQIEALGKRVIDDMLDSATKATDRAYQTTAKRLRRTVSQTSKDEERVAQDASRVQGMLHGGSPSTGSLVSTGSKGHGSPGGHNAHASGSGSHGGGQAWPPAAPVPPKPALGAPNAAQWRYQRYLHQQAQKGKGPNDVLPYGQWKAKHHDVAASGGRPGRGGGAHQSGARQQLENQGWTNVENVQLGTRVDKGKTVRNFVDMVKTDANGNTQYMEVDHMLKSGQPNARYRRKLQTMIDALKPNESLIFVDSKDPSKRILYHLGDDASTKSMG